MYPGPDRVPQQEFSNSYGPPPPLAYQPPPQYWPTAQHVTVNMPRPFNHGLHVVLDLLTCGFWIPVHILLWVVHKG
jgi:hypothetical protein